MENSASSSFAKTAQAVADRAADKAQGGIQTARDSADHAAEHLSTKLEDVRSETGAAVKRGTKRVQTASSQGLNAMTDMAGQARGVASNASDSIVAYTKQNPVKALAIAAGAGAVLYAMIKSLSAARD